MSNDSASFLKYKDITYKAALTVTRCCVDAKSVDRGRITGNSDPTISCRRFRIADHPLLTAFEARSDLDHFG